VTIDLDRNDDPILGTVRVDSQPDRPFVGWIGLLGALEEALETDRHDREGLAPAEPSG
jgi:hypothetical protein